MVELRSPVPSLRWSTKNKSCWSQIAHCRPGASLRWNRKRFRDRKLTTETTTVRVSCVAGHWLTCRDDRASEHRRCLSAVSCICSSTPLHAADNAVNDYFCSVSIVDDGISPEFDRRVSSNVCLDAIYITRESILKFIQKSKAGTSPGPDGIPSSFLIQFKLSLLSSSLCERAGSEVVL